MKALERFLEWGGARKDIALLAVSAVALLISIFELLPLPFDAAWVAIVLCGVPIILEAVIGLVTAFDIKRTCSSPSPSSPRWSSARIRAGEVPSSCNWAACWKR